jgi:ribose 5-phosphate isomerase B
MTRRRVLTERDVRRAAREGRKTLEVGDAVVTPAARDVARSVGLELRAGDGNPSRDAEAAAPVSQETKGGERRTVALGADHGGVALKSVIAAKLAELGYATTDVGTSGTDPVDYPDFAVAVANEVAGGRARAGIMIDGAGIGSCMAANKVRGVRAAMCYDVTTATNAREHNDANLLTLGGGLIGSRLALAIVETFLATPFAGGRHQPRVAKIDALDRR